MSRTVVFLKQLFKQLQKSYLFDGAAALSFYFMLALFPALIVAVSILSFFSLDDLQRQAEVLMSAQIPQDAYSLIMKALEEIKLSHKGSTGFLSAGLIVGFWTASSGVAAALRQINNVHGAKSRYFFSVRLTSIFSTLFLSFFLFLGLSLLVLSGTLKKFLIFYDVYFFNHSLYDLLTYGLAGAIIFYTFLTIYYFGSKESLKRLWLGSLVATLGLLTISKAFSFYVKNFANYSAVYGSIAAVILLMLWFYLLGFLLILGAEINVALKKAYPSHK